MEAFLLAHEPALRLAAFGLALALMALWEVLAPRRVLSAARGRRWPANLAIVMLNTALVRLVLPSAAVGVALSAEEHGWGLLHREGLAPWMAVALGVVLLDLVLYLQHVMFHAVPALWRLHRMHHADLDIDVTTGTRFHPIEIVLSMLVKFAAIAALGIPAVAVFAFEVLLNATSMFNHANVRIPGAVDAALRWLVVTPDMHRVHHSLERDETNSNFGFNLPLWDRLFGTYRAQPRGGHKAMTIGIPEFRDPAECNSLLGMIAIPFQGERGRRPADGYG